MLGLGLTAPQYREYRWRLANGYEYKVTAMLLTPEHAVVRDVSTALFDGQVDVTMPKWDKGDLEVSRTASLTFLDPDKSLGLDSRSPSDGAFYMDRMVRIVCSVMCSFGWVDVPVFTGPIVKVDRDGWFIDVECQGKEWWALGDAWSTGTENGRKGRVMRALLRRAGESDRYMEFPDPVAKVAKPVSIGRESTLWSHAWRVNASLTSPTRVLFYDGRGVARSDPRPTKTAIELKLGDGEMLMDEPQVSYSTDDLINAVRVVGSKKSKGSRTPYASAVVPSDHPLALKRGSGFRRQAEFIDNSDLKSTAACRKVAKDTLDDGLRQHVDASVECLPIYDLEPFDLVQLSTERTSIQIRPGAFTLPLVQVSGQGKPMTIGALVDVRRPKRPIRKA